MRIYSGGCFLIFIGMKRTLLLLLWTLPSFVNLSHSLVNLEKTLTIPKENATRGYITFASLAFDDDGPRLEHNYMYIYG